MGSEDLFHKRKARTAKQYTRKAAVRKPYDRVLIVCEGEKTEPIYLEELRIEWELDSANIEIDGSCGSSPISVVEHAVQLYFTDLNAGNPYDRVFCVFDKDQHSSFDSAINKVDKINRSLSKKFSDSSKVDIFTCIYSIPSFEFWFLLHYVYTTKPYGSVPGKSPSDCLIGDLKAYLPDYSKCQKGLFKMFLEQGALDGAIAYSKSIFEQAKTSGDSNPSTNVHQLVEYLRDIKS